MLLRRDERVKVCDRLVSFLLVVRILRLMINARCAAADVTLKCLRHEKSAPGRDNHEIDMSPR